MLLLAAFFGVVLLAASLLFARISQLEKRASGVLGPLLVQLSTDGALLVPDWSGSELEARLEDEKLSLLQESLLGDKFRFEQDVIFSHATVSPDDRSRAEVFLVSAQARAVRRQFQLTLWHVDDEPVLGSLRALDVSTANLTAEEAARLRAVCLARAAEFARLTTGSEPLPPWLHAPARARYGLYWRGAGEGYMRRVYAHLAQASAGQFEDYKSRYQPPPDWAGWYTRFSPQASQSLCREVDG